MQCGSLFILEHYWSLRVDVIICVAPSWWTLETVIQMFGVMGINPQMIDWSFQFSSQWLALCEEGPVLSTLIPPPLWVHEVMLTDPNARRAVNGTRPSPSCATHAKADKFSAKGDFSSSVLIVISNSHLLGTHMCTAHFQMKDIMTNTSWWEVSFKAVESAFVPPTKLFYKNSASRKFKACTTLRLLKSHSLHGSLFP